MGFNNPICAAGQTSIRWVTLILLFHRSIAMWLEILPNLFSHQQTVPLSDF
jgi:hypothetical protein